MSSPDKILSDIAAITEVLAARLPMLALGLSSPTAARRLEAERMVLEKTDAAIDGFFSLQKYCFDQAMDAWRMPVDADHFAGAIDAYLAPGRKTLHANARRFRGRKDI